MSDNFLKINTKKMKYILNTFLIAVILCNSQMAIAQDVDMERMRRDISVTENILMTLIEESLDGQEHLYMNSVKGQYLEGFGVMFTVPEVKVFGFRLNLPNSDSFIRINEDGETRAVGIATSISEDDSEEIEGGESDEKGKVYGVARNSGNGFRVVVPSLNKDSIRAEQTEQMKEVIFMFLKDYGHLISQLSPDNKILVKTGDTRTRWFSSNRPGNEFSVQATVADIQDFQNGKLSAKAFEEKAEIIDENNKSHNYAVDIVVFGNAMQTIYDATNSDTYFTNSDIEISKIDGYGVIYKMNVYSSRNSRNDWSRDAVIIDGTYSMPTIDKSGISKEERNKEVTNLYPKFIESFKQNLLDYSSTLKSLGTDEFVVFKIKLTECKGCGIPEFANFKIAYSTLLALKQNKISRKEVMELLEVEEIGKQ